VDPLHAEQYLTVYGWRGDAAPLSTEATHAPYVGITHHRSATGLTGLARHHADVGQAVSELMRGGAAVAIHHIEAPLRRERGHCWYYRLPDGFPAGDAASDASAVTIVLEDGRLLGPGHAPHDDVRRRGLGLYSHWDRQLYLSTSDNSDPNTNGRRYTVIATTR
jgi:hypothetical protein